MPGEKSPGIFVLKPKRIMSKFAQCGRHLRFPFVARLGRRGVRFLPMPPAATPVSAAAEQQYQNNNDENQIHGRSPLMVMISERERPAMD
jgi:hypothetical protein